MDYYEVTANLFSLHWMRPDTQKTVKHKWRNNFQEFGFCTQQAFCTMVSPPRTLASLERVCAQWDVLDCVGNKHLKISINEQEEDSSATKQDTATWWKKKKVSHYTNNS